MPKNVLKNLCCLTIPGALFTFLLLELCFRVVIRASEPPYAYFDPKEQLLRYDPRKTRTGICTVGSLGRHPARWRINNLGWNSLVDFRIEGRTKPLIALIGDSFIEGFNVDAGHSVSDILRGHLEDRYDVYGFGLGGANLAQYLQMSRYVNRVFAPQLLIVNMIHNDFDDLFKEHSRVGMLSLEGQATGVFREAAIVPYVPNRFKRMARVSSVFRYLVLNLSYDLGRWRRRIPPAAQDRAQAHVDAESLDSQQTQIIHAVEYLFQKLQEENRERSVIVVMDGPRRDIYADTVEASPVRWMNDVVRQQCQRHQFHFIDMTAPFQDRFRRDGKKFEFDEDYHWNQLGHRVVAEELLGYVQRARLLRPHG